MPAQDLSGHAGRIEILRRAELFVGLPEEVLQKLAAHAIVKKLRRGEMLYSESDEATGLFVVSEGELRSVRQSSDGREQVLSTARAGKTLAEAPVFGGGRYFSTVIADTPAVVLTIGHRDVQQVCHEHPELLWNVVRSLSQSIRTCAELIESLALRNVDQRLAMFLVSIARDQGRHSDDTITFELTLTRSEIASRIGSVREVISRSLAHLHELGLILVADRRTIKIPDIEALRDFAAGIRAAEPVQMLGVV
jgi:CRP/FNR family transcriptional regulator